MATDTTAGSDDDKGGVAVLEVAPRFEPRLWGGARLGQIFRWAPVLPEPAASGAATAQRPIGEAWLTFEGCKIRGESPWAGHRLRDALLQLGSAFLGPSAGDRPELQNGQLPLLVKVLDAERWLSVQVHPDDEYAHRFESHTGYPGKHEAWYVLDVTGNAEVLYGLEDFVERDELRAAIQRGKVTDLLRYEPLTRGQVIPVPAGTIHSIGPGALLFEVQTRSDLTYRLYDFDRGRELHIDKALDVANRAPTPLPAPADRYEDARGATVLLESPSFVMCEWSSERAFTASAPAHSFAVFVGADTDSHDFGRTFVVGASRSVELPAGLWVEVHLPA